MIKGIFFTDIDGTLLDHDTYSYDESKEGVMLLAENRIPLIPVSSKTFAEISLLMDELNLRGPFVFENGCGIAYPGNSDYSIETVGISPENLREFIPVIEKFTGEKVFPLADLSTEDICRLTGLSMEKAVLAKQRIASLPFISGNRRLLAENEIRGLNEIIMERGAVLTKGARFNHLIPAGSGKGVAVKKIIEFYNTDNDSFTTASAGDSYNDLPMFDETDYAYLVRKKDGRSLDSDVKALVTRGIGPAGFTEAVKDYLKKITV